MLPDCRPEHIRAARSFKKMMTGCLNADVDSNPPFPGKERHFLRAQLARIFHGT
jgi:radial spoke head protein 4A